MPINGYDFAEPFYTGDDPVAEVIRLRAIAPDDALPFPNRYIGTLRRPHPDWSGDCQGRDAELVDIVMANLPVEPGFQGGRLS